MEAFATANGTTLLRMLESAACWLKRSARSLDALNVFPVPDGDTGANMLLTVQAALSAVPSRSGPASAEAVSAMMARGAMEGARGNSGIILSQFFRGLASALRGRKRCRAADLAAAFTLAESFARNGISNPKEGTILTVLADVSRALAGSLASSRFTLAAALETAVTAAAASVERTPSLLPALREAGVVDAGAKGMLLILEGCLHALRDGRQASGRARSLADDAPPPAARQRLARQDDAYGFCTDLLLTGENLPLPEIRKRLDQEGTSVVLVGDERRARIHIHTPHPDAVVEYARSIGEVSRLEIQDMDRQNMPVPASPAASREMDRVTRETPGQPAVVAPNSTAVVALVGGDGLAAVFRSMGAGTIDAGAGKDGPDPGEIGRALGRFSVRRIILLPDSPGALDAARKAGAPQGMTVRIVPSRTIPQAVAALVEYRFDGDLDANVDAMTSALASVRSVDIAAGAADPAARLERLLSDVEPSSVSVATIYGGSGADPSLVERAAAACRSRFPGCAVETIRGGQAQPLLVVSLE